MNGSDRRHRRLLGLPLLATALLAGACTAGGDDQGQGATTAPASTPAATPPASPTTGETGAAVTIPKSAFVDLPSELRKGTPQSTQVADALPKLCAEEFATGGRSTAAAAMMSTYKTPEDPPENVPFGMLNQTVFAFAGTDAADYLRRVREAVESCRSFPDAGNTVTVRSRPLADTGDGGLLVTLTRPATNLNGTRREGTATSQIIVVRVADGVTVVHDQGWEASSNNPDFADDFAAAAVRGLKSWQT
ncbi:hypothetical protein [Micromonospora sp. WMMD998]|uniref:hypothetical protein n=1 Tax=Micromonospora sp. WMMD998 TaxID=3016092 RepID=UPI00249B8B04|nr:hypothetical protein [Micromonospora sp. WMMD998]WFE39366.1 hypothetical protein O7619_13420 [Micromonospora sp. WMMD998]